MIYLTEVTKQQTIKFNKTTAYKKAKDVIVDHLQRATECYWQEGEIDGQRHNDHISKTTEKEFTKIQGYVDKVAYKLIKKLEPKK